MKIFKYIFKPETGPQDIMMPGGMFEPLHFGFQRDGWDRPVLVLWASVLDHLPMEPRRFHLAFTGDETPNQGVGGYIGTTQVGSIVWHLFVLHKGGG